MKKIKELLNHLDKYLDKYNAEYNRLGFAMLFFGLVLVFVV